MHLMSGLNNIFLVMGSTHSYSYFLVLAIALIVAVYLVVSMFLLNKDKIRLNRSLAHLEAVKRRGVEYELVLQAMQLATWKIDLRNMTVTFDNDYRQQTDLYTPTPGTPLKDVLKLLMPEDAKKFQTMMEGVIQSKQDIYHIQYRIIGNNGNYYWSDAYGMVSERDEKGKPVTIIGTARNISKQKEMEQQLIDARLQAEESDRLKTAFIQNISHEVRTPLNAIVGFSDILTEVTDPKEREGLMAIIKDNNNKLLQIFEDMMNISKMEAHDEKANLTLSQFDVVQLAAEKVAKYSGQNKNANVTLEFVCQEKALEIVSDKERVAYILGHFIENAMKFTGKGTITAGITPKADNYLRIWVSDTGKGIDDSDKEKIFKRFYKVDSFIQGAGLGLSVCRSYALSLKGTVGVESRLGMGSTFWAEIPEKL